jgi:hypothetical protein
MQNSGRWAREAALADQSRSGRWGEGGRPAAASHAVSADGTEFGAVVVG